MITGLFWLPLALFLVILGIVFIIFDFSFLLGFILIFGGFACGLYWFRHLSDYPNGNRETEKTITGDTILEFYITRSVRDIDYNYMLELTPAEIQHVAHAKYPATALRELRPHTLPTVGEFLLKMETMLNMTVDKLALPEEQKNDIYAYYLSSYLYGVTPDVIKDIARSFSRQLPREWRFLKIQYELACLGIIMTYASESADAELAKKVNDYRRTRE